MWWRVELETGGKVAKCEPVLEPTKPKRLLRFVEADSREEAIDKATNWLKVYREQQRRSAARRAEKRRARKVCICCDGRSGSPPKEGRDTCEPCLERKTNWRQNWVAKGSPPRKPADPIVTKARYDALHAGGMNLHAPTVLKNFDQMGPRIFREWLVSIIEENKARFAELRKAGGT